MKASPIQRKDHLDGVAVGMLLTCCLLWGFQQVLAKATMVELDPLFQASLRFIGATVVLMAWCRWRGVAIWASDGTLRSGLLAGSFFAAEFALLYLGLRETSATRLTLFLYTSPFWVALLVPLFVKSERLRPVQWVGLACAFLAVAFALQDRGIAGSGSSLRGDLLGIAAGLMWGLTTVIVRTTALARASAEKMLFYQVTVSAAVLPLVSLALGERWHFSWTPFAASSMFFQTVVGAFASYLAWMWLLGRYPATKVSAFVFLTPVFAMGFGALWLREPITWKLLLALALVALGIVLVNRRAR